MQTGWLVVPVVYLSVFLGGETTAVLTFGVIHYAQSSMNPPLHGVDQVYQQHRHGHRPHAAGDGGDVARDL